MREIKFRCWQKTCEEDKDGNAIWEMIDADCLAFENYEPLVDLLTSDEDSEIFMQYTGLKDKNGEGKEVYDKDRFPDGGVVEWIKDGWFVKYSAYEVRLSEYLENDPSREVIGNIYEHKNLLDNK